MFGWGSSDINDLMTNAAGAVLDFSLLSAVRILPANLKKQLQSAVSMLWLKYFSFYLHIAIMVTAQTWFVHDVLNVP
ncbi:MAG: hypothetical protein ACLSA5_10575 [Agathobacter rectalis]